MKVEKPKVMFIWADKWLDGVIEQNDTFASGYCIRFGGEIPFSEYAPSKVALDYVKQWYYVDEPGNIHTNDR